MCKASKLSFDEIEEYAESFRLSNMRINDLDSVKNSVKKIGGKIIFLSPMVGYNSRDFTMLKVNGPNDFIITPLPQYSIFRDNWEIARTLGHYVLHSGNPMGSKKLNLKYGNQDDLVNRQANRFAAALTMPKEQFIKTAKRYDNELGILSGIFNVYVPAIKARLNSLGLTKTHEEIKAEKRIEDLITGKAKDITLVEKWALEQYWRAHAAEY